MNHIQKWRRKLFIIGFYSRDARRPELQHCLCLTPLDMEPWIASIEEKILIDFKLARRASRRLDLTDLFEVCGQKEHYTIADAKRLHKQQWTAQEYSAVADIDIHGSPRISQEKMLDILRLRSRYIAERGATLNNPHITKTHLNRFAETDRVVAGPYWAAGVRHIAMNFVRTNPTHSSIGST